MGETKERHSRTSLLLAEPRRDSGSSQRLEAALGRLSEAVLRA
jgi:hypothetical protein